MITIDKKDISKLKPNVGKITKCFEQFCCQIAKREFGFWDDFIPIEGAVWRRRCGILFITF